MSEARREKNTSAIPLPSPVFKIPPFYRQKSAGERFILTDALIKRGREWILNNFTTDWICCLIAK